MARIPKINKLRMEKIEEEEHIQVDIRPDEYVDDLEIFDDPKELHRFIARLKYYIRSSMEYKRLMKFLKRYKGMYCCGIHTNVTMWDKFQIHVHHTPFVMEDIVYIVIRKRKELNESLKMSAIAKEVMMLHYLGLIGLYPLCETCHEYAHGDTNDLFIPMKSIFGDPVAFYDIYKDFIVDAMQTKFDNIKILNEGYTVIEREIPPALIKKYIYVTNKGQEVMSTSALYGFLSELNK